MDVWRCGKNGLLLWIVGDIGKEAGENPTHDLIGKPDKDAKPIGHHKCCIQDQRPHRMGQFPFAVGNGLIGGITVKRFPIPIGKRIGKLHRNDQL